MGYHVTQLANGILVKCSCNDQVYTPSDVIWKTDKVASGLMFGTPETEGITCQSQYVNDLRLRLENCYRMDRENLSLEQLRQKSQYDKKQVGSVF